MTDDKRESELIEDSSPQWIRTIDGNGNSKKTNANVFTKNSDRVTVKKITMPNINTDAVKIASINTPGGYYNASVFVKIDMFQLSCYGVIGIYRVNQSINPFARLNGYCISTISNIIFVNNGNAIDIYMTGNYSSAYHTFQSDVISSSELISFEGAGTIVPVSSLENVMKSINISEALQ